MRDSSKCRRCKRSEPFDESDLCEDCLADIESGCTLRGDYGKAEQHKCRAAVADGYVIDPDDDVGQTGYRAEAGRLLNLAKYWA